MHNLLAFFRGSWQTLSAGRWPLAFALAASASLPLHADGTSQVAAYCQSLSVEYPDAGGLGATYQVTTQTYEGAPIYKAQRADGRVFYLFKYRVGFAPLGYVWVTSTNDPDPKRWGGNAYGYGQYPETASWTGSVDVRCADYQQTQTKRSGQGAIGKHHSGSGNVHPIPARTVDLLVVYTPEAMADKTNFGRCGKKRKSCGVEAFIDQQIRALNESLANSGVVGAQVKLVHIGPIDLPEPEFKRFLTKFDLSGDSKKDRQNLLRRMQESIDLFTEASSGTSDSRLEAIKELHHRRKVFGADIVHILFGPSGLPACGIGMPGIFKKDGVILINEKDAYSISRTVCNSHHRLSMAHEIGHNFGLKHDQFTEGDSATNTEFERGYVDTDAKIITVMAYLNECNSLKIKCKPVPYYSNPDIDIKVGSRRVTVGSRTADTARWLDQHIDLAALFGGQGIDGLSIWVSPLDDKINLEVPRGSTVEKIVYLYNRLDRNVLIDDYEFSVTGGLEANSLSFSIPNGCKVKGLLRAGEVCRMKATLKGNQTGRSNDINEMAISLSTIEQSPSRKKRSVQGEIRYRVVDR